ncbi:MAG: TolC family protein [Desulfuromonadales bacterium]|jgi:outer membrane protein
MRIFPVMLCLLLLAGADARASALSLQDVLDMAREHNPTLKTAAHDPRIAAEEVTRAKAGYLPTVDFSGGYTAEKDAQEAKASTGSSNVVFPTQEADFGFFNFTIDQTLYDFGRTASRVQGTEALQKASEFDYLGNEQSVFLQTVSAFYQVLAVQKALQAADEEVKQMEDHLRVARNLFEQGVVTRNDVLQAEVQLADSRQRQLAARNELANAWLRLNYLAGRKPQERGELQEAAAFKPSQGEQSPQQAVADRPELKAQRLVLQASEQEVKQSKAQFWPEIFASAGADYMENKYVVQQTLYSATVGLRINLFDGFTTTSRLREAVAREARSRDRFRDLQEQAALEYRTAQNDAKVAYERIGVTQKAIQQGEENLRINQNRYQEQVGTATDVIDAQTLLTRTRLENYKAIFDYEVALARMKRAAGKL